jgi:uncharacterized damage-inducible protein DinB
MTDVVREGAVWADPPIVQVFRHNLWANVRVLDACAALGEAELGSSVAGTYGSVLGTLTHILGAEQRYVAGLAGVPRPEPLERAAPKGIAELRTLAVQSGEALIEAARRVTADDRVEVDFGGQPYSLPATVFLIQAINHATEHRAQIATTLTQHGLEPTDVSAWAYNGEMAGR